MFDRRPGARHTSQGAIDLATLTSGKTFRARKSLPSFKSIDGTHNGKDKVEGGRKKRTASNCRLLRRMANLSPRRTSITYMPPSSQIYPLLAEVLSGQHDHYSKLKNSFMQYAMIHACEENIQFLIEFEKLKVLRQRTRGQLGCELASDRAMAIADRYISSKASHSLNLCHKLQMRVEQSVDSTFDELFDALTAVAREIASLVELGIYDAFIDNHIYDLQYKRGLSGLERLKPKIHHRCGESFTGNILS